MLKRNRYTRKEDKYILDTYDRVKDDQTKAAEVYQFIGSELNRSPAGIQERHKILRGKLRKRGMTVELKPRYNKKPKAKPNYTPDYYGAVSAVMTMIIVALIMYIVFGG